MTLRRSAVTATILCHNSLPRIKSVLYALRRQTMRPDRIIAIDNASTDGTPEFVERQPDIELFRMDRNLGVGSGHNRAIREALSEASCQFVWVLEHDVVPEPDCLRLLIWAYRDLHQKGWHVGSVSPRLERSYEEEMMNRRQGATPTPGGRLTFNAVVFERSTLESLGPFRDDFFVGLEDTEFAERMTAAGLLNVYVPDALAIHPNKGNSRFGIIPSVSRSYYSTRNSLFLDHKLRRKAFAVPLYIGRAVAGTLRSLVREDRKAARVAARWVATFDGMVGRLGRRTYWFMMSPGDAQR